MSVTCSYQSIVQLEDGITPDQTGSYVENIRHRRRDALCKKREEKRDERLREIRKAFETAEFLVQSKLDDFSDSEDSQSIRDQDTSSPWPSAQSGDDAWNNATSNLNNRPSPSRSPYSTCSTPTTVCADEVDGPSVSAQIKKSQHIKRPKQRISIKDFRQKRNMDKLPMELYDQEGIIRDYLLLTKCIQEEEKNIKSIYEFLNSNWRIVLRPFFSHHEHLRTDTLHLLTSAVIHNIIEPVTMLNMLSHGLMHGIARILRDNDGPRRVTNFIRSVHKTMNVVFPYLIDMASSARLFKTFSDLAQINESDLDCLLDLYIDITPVCISKIITGASEQPLIPGLSTQTRLSEVTLNYYGPMSTAMKMINPSLISTIAAALSMPVNYFEPNVISRILYVLYHIVNLTYLQMTHDNVFSVFPLLKAFDLTCVVDNVRFLRNYYEQQYKQSATPELRQILETLTQFEGFYKRCSGAFDSFQHQYRRHIGMRV